LNDAERILRPSPELVRLYFLYLVIAILVAILPWYIPLLLLAPEVGSIITIILALIVVPVVCWIPKYYSSLVYIFRDEEIECRQGVWFRMLSIVPYNRITNVDVVQGPLSRWLGIATVKVQTAGYSGQVSRAEAKILGVKNYEEVKEYILSKIRGTPTMAMKVSESPRLEDLLRELVRIREILESTLARG